MISDVNTNSPESIVKQRVTGPWKRPDTGEKETLLVARRGTVTAIIDSSPSLLLIL